MPQDTDWLIMGDFNFIRSPADRNKPGGDLNDMLLFNEEISNLGIVELPLKGRKFTWSNMQKDPLLEKLDWFFHFSLLDSLLPSYFCLSSCEAHFRPCPLCCCFQYKDSKS
jgi:hypothetical protein